MLISAPELRLVTSANPGQRAGIVKGILISVPWTRNRITHGRVATNMNEWRTYANIKARLILKTQARRWSVVNVLVEKKFIAQERKAQNADRCWREEVSFLGHEVLSAMVFSDRKPRHARSAGREWVEAGAVAEHVAQVQVVGGEKIMIQAQSELIFVLLQSLRGSK